MWNGPIGYMYQEITLMRTAIPESIYAIVPKELRPDFGIYWQKKTNRYYVYRDLGYTYDPKKGRSVAKRIPLGSIKNGKFTYSPSFLKNQTIVSLSKEVTALREGKSVATVEETVQTANRQGLIKQIRKASRAVRDRRQRGKVLFPLDIVLFVALLAACGGYTGAVSIALYWKQNRAELSALISDFPDEDISHDTINRLFQIIKPKQFQAMLTSLAVPLTVSAIRMIHIDGQAVRASKNEGHKHGYYIFNSYDSNNGLALAAKLINEKKNEMSESISLLKMIDLGEGDILTADALNTQRELAAYVHKNNAAYCLAVKDNHPRLFAEVRNLFAVTHPDQILLSEDLTVEHGRIENRTARVIRGKLLSKAFFKLWPGLEDGCIVEAVTKVETKSARSPDKRDSEVTRCFISSIRYEEASADRLMAIIRRHWSVENRLHWHLDNHFSQDRIQCKNANYLENRVTLNKIGLNCIQAARKAELERRGKAMSVKSYMQLCNTAAGTIDVLARIPNFGADTLQNVKE